MLYNADQRCSHVTNVTCKKVSSIIADNCSNGANISIDQLQWEMGRREDEDRER